MLVRFFLFLMTILLLLIFWELSKIHSRIKKALAPPAGLPGDQKSRTAVPSSANIAA